MLYIILAIGTQWGRVCNGARNKSGQERGGAGNVVGPALWRGWERSGAPYHYNIYIYIYIYILSIHIYIYFLLPITYCLLPLEDASTLACHGDIIEVYSIKAKACAWPEVDSLGTLKCQLRTTQEEVCQL